MVQTPIILISSGRSMGKLSMQRQQSELYGECLLRAGAASALYAGGDAQLLAARFDGLLLSGGGDLHPALYGQIRQATLSIDAARDAEEQDLYRAFFTLHKPILGICRGVQAINVFCGGTLHQHMERHEDCCHEVACAGLLSSLVGPCCTVNSYHHQDVDRVGHGLRVAARATDGVIEALRHETAPVLGVQWHPERMSPPLCEDVSGADHLPLFTWLCQHA